MCFAEVWCSKMTILYRLIVTSTTTITTTKTTTIMMMIVFIIIKSIIIVLINCCYFDDNDLDNHYLASDKWKKYEKLMQENLRVPKTLLIPIPFTDQHIEKIGSHIQNRRTISVIIYFFLKKNTYVFVINLT